MPYTCAPRAPSLSHQPKTQQKCIFVVACVSAMKSPLLTGFPSFFHTGQLQFLQHQMQQQQMAMGTAAPQVGAPQQHTASQPRSKRKRSMPQPLPKSWKAQITLSTVPSKTRTWMIYTVLFVCLTVETKTMSFPCLFLADIFVWNVCQRSLENQICFWP